MTINEWSGKARLKKNSFWMTPLTQKSSIVLSAHIASIFYGKVGEFMNAMPSLRAFLTRSGEAITIIRSLTPEIVEFNSSTCDYWIQTDLF